MLVVELSTETDTGIVELQARSWTEKRKIGRKKVGRSIAGRQVKAIDEAWWFAKAIGLPLNRFLSIRPHGIDGVPAEDRSNLWSRYRNKLAQFARDNGFAFACIWSRESEPMTGNKEHLHVLMHVPPKLQKRFDAMIRRWSDALDLQKDREGGGGSNSAAIDCRPANYRTHRTRSWKKRNVVTYITKNSPQAAWTKERSFQKGGPIVGKRTGMTRILDQNCIARHQQKLRAVASSRTPYKKRIMNYDAIISQTAVVTKEIALKKIAGNSNFSAFPKGEAA
jgi:hypothetical protein